MRLREERERAHLSQRELARRLGLSGSLISQIESGQSKPSVSTLYAIVTELGVSLDDVFRVHDHGRMDGGALQGPGSEPGAGTGPVVHPQERHTIELDSGVRWERLTSHQHENLDFLHVVYDAGGASSPDERLMRHPGREYGVVLPVTAIVDQMLLSMRQKGWGGEDHSALLRVIEDLSQHGIG